MKEYVVRLKEWWNNLPTREKRMLGGGGSIALIFLLYQGLLAPSLSYVDSLRERIASQQKLLAWMQAADAQLATRSQSSQGAVKTTPILLLSYLQKQLNQAGLNQSLKQLKQSGGDTVDVQFQKVDFDKVMQLLINTLHAQSVQVTQISVTGDKSAGMVNANVVMKVV